MNGYYFRIHKFRKNILFQFSILAVDCQWAKWSVGACSAKCGSGTRTKKRTKFVIERNGGTCIGQPTKTIKCMDKECPGIN